MDIPLDRLNASSAQLTVTLRGRTVSASKQLITLYTHTLSLSHILYEYSMSVDHCMGTGTLNMQVQYAGTVTHVLRWVQVSVVLFNYRNK